MELNQIEGKIWAQNVSIRLDNQLFKVKLLRRYVRQYKVHLVSAAVILQWLSSHLILLRAQSVDDFMTLGRGF